MLHSKTALRRAWFLYAAKLSKLLRVTPKWLQAFMSQAGHPTPPLNDHLARDIGLSPTEFERQRLRLPSQHTHHPYG